MKCDCGCEGEMELSAVNRKWVPDWLLMALGDGIVTKQPFRWILLRDPTEAERKMVRESGI
jgi:hypothetical protein